MSGPLHVYPVDDRIVHTLNSECVCGPRTELVETDHGDEWLVTHHSLDGRERNES